MQERDRAQGALDAAVRAFDGMGDETAVRERLASLRQARDDAQERVDQVGATDDDLVIDGDGDWDRLTLDERRALIRRVVERATVAPGRGADRIAVELFRQ